MGETGKIPVVHYARVSTKERALKGYSIPGQLHDLDENAKSEGFEVVERVKDEGFSRDNLDRPGLNRIRELAAEYHAAGTPLTVWAWKRDRYGEAPYPEILSLELESFGVKLRSLDDSGEGDDADLINSLKDAIARKERKDLVRRTRMGKYQKARQGKIIAAGKSPYGYRYTEQRDGLLENPEEMITLRRMFEWAAEGFGPFAIQRKLKEIGAKTPTGNDVWQPRSIKYILLEDIYRSLTYEELERMLPSDALARLDPGKTYGIKWSGRIHHKRRQEGSVYRHTHKKTDRDQWIGIPVEKAEENSLPRELVEAARFKVSNRKTPERKHAVRVWHLNGFLRCSCGQALSGIRRYDKGRKLYLYYRCNSIGTQLRFSCKQPYLRAEELEELIWGAVCDLVTNPRHLRKIVESARTLRTEGKSGESSRSLSEARELRKILADVREQRARYHRMAAEDLIDFDELRSRLEEQEHRRRAAGERLEEIETASVDATRRLEELDSALADLQSLSPGDLAHYAPEQRRELYEALEMEVHPAGDTFYLSFTGSFLHEMKYIQDHFAKPDAVRVDAENFS